MDRENNRQGALELSIGTIVVIVIGMSMLVLGLVLVKTIFSGSIGSVDKLNDGVLQEITKLFDDTDGNILIKLGATNTAKIKPGTESFKIAIGAQHPGGAQITNDNLHYGLRLSSESGDNCISVLGQRKTEDLFRTPLNTKSNEFGRRQGSTAAALIEITIPDGTAVCTQKVNVDLYVDGATTSYDGDFFIIEIAKKGIF
mgnify:FL=1